MVVLPQMSEAANTTVNPAEKLANGVAPDGPPSKPAAKKASEKEDTKVASLLVSIAALIVSASSFYQAYLNRLYSEDVNRPVLTTALESEGLFLPQKGWVIGNAKVSNVGKMTATKVGEQSFRVSVNGFSDECFVLLGRSDTKKEPKEILPGGSEIFAYIVLVQPKCLVEFSAADPVPTVSVITQITYTDRSGLNGRQELTLPISSKRRRTAADLAAE